ncbi:MAG: recombinase family protein [Alphaproteobacteria bacterium]
MKKSGMQLRRSNTPRVISEQKVWPGAVRYLLSNRIYLGEIRHHDEWFPGQHPPIVDVELFEAVQALFKREKGTGHSTRSPLQGLVFDDAGFLMSPTYVTKKGKRYRYYVSRADLRGQGDEPGSLARISATGS